MSTALQYQLKSLAIHEKFGPSKSQVQSLNAVAVTYASLGDTKQAKAYYERAIAMADTVAPAMMRSFLRANYGSFLGFNGELARGTPDACGSDPGGQSGAADTAIHATGGPGPAAAAPG